MLYSEIIAVCSEIWERPVFKIDCSNIKFVFSFFLHVLWFIYFGFMLLLPEGREGESWEPSNKITLSSSPHTSSAVTSACHYTPFPLSLSHCVYV
jgi:hypothetical protein